MVVTFKQQGCPVFSFLLVWVLKTYVASDILLTEGWYEDDCTENIATRIGGTNEGVFDKFGNITLTNGEGFSTCLRGPWYKKR